MASRYFGFVTASEYRTGLDSAIIDARKYRYLSEIYHKSNNELGDTNTYVETRGEKPSRRRMGFYRGVTNTIVNIAL